MKRVISAILTMALLVTFTACNQGTGNASAGGSANSGNNSAPESSGGSQELSGSVVFLSGETDEEQVTVTRQAIEEFEKLHPNAKIDLVLSGTDDREEKILADLYAGAPVDIIQVDSESICSYASNGILLPLDDLVTEIGEDDFLEGSRIIYDGHDYGMPYSGCSMLMYVRTDLLKQEGLEVPKTWSELLEVAKAMTKDGMYGCCLPAGQNNATTLWMNLFINQAGGNVFGEDLKPTLDSEAVVKALKFYQELAQYCPSGITSYGYGEQITAFCSGSSAISFYQGRIISRVATEAPDLIGKYEIHPIPTCDDGPDLQFASYTYYSIGAKCENPDLAKAFLKFLCTGETAMKFGMSAGGHMTPALRSVSDLMYEYLDTSEDKFAKENADYIKNSFAHAAGSNTFNESVNAGGVKGKEFKRNGILNPYYNYVRQYNTLSGMAQRVLIEGQDPSTAAAQAQKELTEKLDNLA